MLAQCQVAEKRNEISAIKPLLEATVVTGRILTVDAIHTHRNFCRQLRRLQGDYFVIVKANQPTVREDAEGSPE